LRGVPPLFANAHSPSFKAVQNSKKLSNRKRKTSHCMKDIDFVSLIIRRSPLLEVVKIRHQDLKIPLKIGLCYTLLRSH
jgi:hypothetical protein